jgi:hypothetical protein
MSICRGTIRTLIVLCGVALCAGAWGQNASSGQSSSGQSLGEAARKARKEHAAATAPSARVLDSDDDGPDSGGVWRIRMYGKTPFYEVSITLPRSPRWTRAAAEPRPVVIPLPGPDDDPNRVIRVYAAALLYPFYPDGSRTFLQGWFARPEYFGQPAHIVFAEHIQIDGLPANVSHFSVANGALKYRGLSVVMNSPNGTSGFACVYRDQDSGAATSICDAIVRSANDQSLALSLSTRREYPAYSDPPAYDPRDDDPPYDPPEDDDPR